MEIKDYIKLFEIHFELENNIGVSGYKPSEKDIDEGYITRNDYEFALQEYQKGIEFVIFSNTYLEWDSCDCGDGYGCSHGDGVYEIRVGKKVISVDDDCLDFGGSYIKMENLTVGDFFRHCQLAGIELEFTEYGKTLLTLPNR